MIDLVNHLWAWGWCLVPIAAVAIVWWALHGKRNYERRHHRDWWLKREMVWSQKRTLAIKRGDFTEAARCLDRANSCLDAAERK